MCKGWLPISFNRFDRNCARETPHTCFNTSKHTLCYIHVPVGFSLVPVWFRNMACRPFPVCCLCKQPFPLQGFFFGEASCPEFTGKAFLTLVRIYEYLGHTQDMFHALKLTITFSLVSKHCHPPWFHSTVVLKFLDF